MSKKRHTSPPWSWDGKYTVTIPHANGDTSFRTMPEDGEFMVHAVACHDDMVEALLPFVSQAKRISQDHFEGHTSPMDTVKLVVTVADLRRVILAYDKAKKL